MLIISKKYLHSNTYTAVWSSNWIAWPWQVDILPQPSWWMLDHHHGSLLWCSVQGHSSCSCCELNLQAFDDIASSANLSYCHMIIWNEQSFQISSICNSCLMHTRRLYRQRMLTMNEYSLSWRHRTIQCGIVHLCDWLNPSSIAEDKTVPHRFKQLIHALEAQCFWIFFSNEVFGGDECMEQWHCSEQGDSSFVDITPKPIILKFHTINTRKYFTFLQFTYL